MGSTVYLSKTSNIDININVNVNSQKIKSVGDLLIVVEEIEKYLKKKNLLDKYEVYYRGQKEYKYKRKYKEVKEGEMPEYILGNLNEEKDWYKPLPSVFRDKRKDKENMYYYEAIRRFPDRFMDITNHISYLSIMQHHQIPTRILDLTRNPLVALWFAALDEDAKYQGEGAFFIVLVPKVKNEGKYNEVKLIKNDTSDTVEFLASMAAMDENHRKAIIKEARRYMNDKDKTFLREKKIEEFNKTEAIEYLLHETRKYVHTFEPVIDPAHFFELFAVDSNFLNARIRNQQGSFLIAGSEDVWKDTEKFDVIDCKKIKPIYKLKLYLISDKVLAIAFPVPNLEADVQVLKKELRMLGITRASIYPELQQLGGELEDI